MGRLLICGVLRIAKTDMVRDGPAYNPCVERIFLYECEIDTCSSDAFCIAVIFVYVRSLRVYREDNLPRGGCTLSLGRSIVYVLVMQSSFAVVIHRTVWRIILDFAIRRTKII